MSAVPRQCEIYGISLVHQLCGEIDRDGETGVSVAGSVANVPMLGFVRRLVMPFGITKVFSVRMEVSNVSPSMVTEAWLHAVNAMDMAKRRCFFMIN